MTKRIILRVLTLTVLIKGMYHFMTGNPGAGSWSALLLYGLIPLVSISITTKQEQYLCRISCIIGAGMILLGGVDSTYHWAGAIFLIGIVFSIMQHRYLIDTRATLRPRSFSIVHSSLFCAAVAGAATFSLMGTPKLNVSCEQLYTGIRSNISTVLIPLSFTSDQISNIKHIVDTFFTKSSNDLIQSKVEEQVSQQLNETFDTAGLADDATLSNILGYYKHTLVENTISTKQDLNDKLCNVVFDQLKQWYEKPGFKVSVFASLALFIYPLIKIFILLWAWILSGIYKLLKKVGFIVKTEEQETIEVWHI